MEAAPTQAGVAKGAHYSQEAAGVNEVRSRFRDELRLQRVGLGSHKRRIPSASNQCPRLYPSEHCNHAILHRLLSVIFTQGARITPGFGGNAASAPNPHTRAMTQPCPCEAVPAERGRDSDRHAPQRHESGAVLPTRPPGMRLPASRHSIIPPRTANGIIVPAENPASSIEWVITAFAPANRPPSPRPSLRRIARWGPNRSRITKGVIQPDDAP
jgi:hypothetical protein